MERCWYVVAFGLGWADRIDGLSADEAMGLHSWFVGLGYGAEFFINPAEANNGCL